MRHHQVLGLRHPGHRRGRVQDHPRRPASHGQEEGGGAGGGAPQGRPEVGQDKGGAAGQALLQVRRHPGRGGDGAGLVDGRQVLEGASEEGGSGEEDGAPVFQVHHEPGEAEPDQLSCLHGSGGEGRLSLLRLQQGGEVPQVLGWGL